MALRCLKDCYVASVAGPYKYHGAITDPSDGTVIRPADIPGVTAPPLLDEEIEWSEGEVDENGSMVTYETRTNTGVAITKQRGITKKGNRIARLKELGLFVEIGGEAEDSQKITTAEDRILADLERKTNIADEGLLELYRDAGVRSVRNKIEILEKLLSN